MDDIFGLLDAGKGNVSVGSNTILHALFDVVAIVDFKGIIHYLWSSVENVFGYTRDFLAIQDVVYTDDFNSVMELVRVSGHKLQRARCRCRHRDGRCLLAEVLAKMISVSSAEFVVLALGNICEYGAKDRPPLLTDSWFEALVENSCDGIYRSTPEGRYVYVNDALVRMLGYNSKQELMAINIPEDLYANSSERPSADQRNVTFTRQLKRKDGTYIWAEISSWVLSDEKGTLIYYQGVVRDITKRKEAELRNAYLSFHDSLTGLYNRAYFEEEMRRLDRERQLPISIIMGDVNGLKLTNDGLGHSAGDEMLRQTARVLRRACRAEDIIARWGGDEFVILLPKAPESVAKSICQRITEACRSVRLGPIGLSIALGYATKTDPRQKLTSILDKAENWVYQRKLLEGMNQRVDIVNSLDAALREKGIETEEHITSIADLANRTARVLGLSENDLNGLKLLARLHDIGKIAIPDTILNKQGPLSEDEWTLMKKHPEIGYRIVIALPDLAPIGESVLAHHERWDGNGYPRGLKRKEIPLLARIISVVDAYDVMTRGRPYLPAVAPDKALDMIRKGAATQFDPEIVEAFLYMKETTGVAD